MAKPEYTLYATFPRPANPIRNPGAGTFGDSSALGGLYFIWHIFGSEGRENKCHVGHACGRDLGGMCCDTRADGRSPANISARRNGI